MATVEYQVTSVGKGQRFVVLRVKTLGRPKDRAASQILRKPSSIDVRKPNNLGVSKKKNSFVPWCEREGAFPSPLLSLNPCPPSSSTELLSRLLLFYAVNHFSKNRTSNKKILRQDNTLAHFVHFRTERHLLSSWVSVFD